MGETITCPACGRAVEREDCVGPHDGHDTGGEVLCLECHEEVIFSDSDLHCPGCER
jgi:hypothetical protein